MYTVKKLKIKKCHISVTKKDIANSNRFELHEPRGTVSEFFTTIREKIVSGVGGLNTKYVQKN